MAIAFTNFIYRIIIIYKKYGHIIHASFWGCYLRLFVGGSPALDLPSTEKVFKHDIIYREGSFECKTCGTIAATTDAITSQPCTKRGVFGDVPGKSGDCMCRLVEFSFDWPTKIQEMIGEHVDETWEVQPKNGRTFRITNFKGELYYDGEVPKKSDFPVMIVPVPKEKFIEEHEEELERLKIEEALLSEILHLQELESRVNSTVPASSDAAPSSFLNSSLVRLGHTTHVYSIYTQHIHACTKI